MTPAGSPYLCHRPPAEQRNTNKEVDKQTASTAATLDVGGSSSKEEPEDEIPGRSRRG